MSTALAPQRAAGNGNREVVPQLAPPRLPYHPAIEERFGVDRASWKALVEAIFPNATSTESVILALSYCRARKLDPFKKNVHIVPIWDKNRGTMVDTIWPGIGELRTTAFRTGDYAGREATAFGPDITKTFTGVVGGKGREREVEVTVTFPEWGQVTVYRIVKGNRVAFAGPRVYWAETYSTQGRTDVPNEMWENRPRGQLDKCAEAAALRAAFPEEIGGDHIPEEIQSSTGPSAPEPAALPAPTGGSRASQVLHRARQNTEFIEQVEQIPIEEPIATTPTAGPTGHEPSQNVPQADSDSPQSADSAGGGDEVADLSDWKYFVAQCEAAAKANHVDPEHFDAAMKSHVVKTKIKSPRRKEWEPDRLMVLQAWKQNRVKSDGTITPVE